MAFSCWQGEVALASLVRGTRSMSTIYGSAKKTAINPSLHLSLSFGGRKRSHLGLSRCSFVKGIDTGVRPPPSRAFAPLTERAKLRTSSKDAPRYV